ncbi:dynein intermediate chain 3, ciliary-like [Prorops nasuta]|uniref:dynein intermediate chain 3, ciliary-like n=1 Tax=Prorops nasuta TaxID=863751 RepID=UPI0034CED5BD
MESKYVYEKTRADFGKQCIFDTFGPNVDEEILPDPGKMDDFIVMESRDAATQLSKQMALHEVQSSAFATRNSGMFHFEGGWPKDIYPLDEEVTARYRRRVEKSEIWAPKLRPLFQMTERFVLQNNAVNIYQHYFDDMIPTPLIKPQELRIVNVYTDTQPPARPVSGISWAPYMLRQLAVSYCFPIDQTIPGASKKAHIWDFAKRNLSIPITNPRLFHVCADNPNSPTISLEALYPIVVTEFNPRHPSVLISGLTSGQVCCWDIRHGYSPVQVSPASVSHKNPSRVIVKWLCARSSAEFLSGATSDGRAMWWDARKLNKPIETVIFDMKESFDIESEKEEAGVLSLNFESKLNMLMFGMENGVVFGYSSESQTPTEKLTKRFNAHLGPVIAVDRNTYSPEVFLTLSNVKVKIWSDDVREVELLSSEPFNDALTGGCWSKHRYSVFYTINTRGDLCAWDLLQNTELPILKEHISSQILTAIAPQMNGNLLAIGDNGGSLYFVEPSNFFLNFTYTFSFSIGVSVGMVSITVKQNLYEAEVNLQIQS